MVSKIKSEFYNLILSLDYNATDNGVYEEKFPWLMLRTTGHDRTDILDIRYDNITYTLDIFSTYSGEKELLEIIENIGNHLIELRQNNSSIMYIQQKSCKILDDNKKGPVKKHAVIEYKFICATGLEEEDANG